MSPRVRAPLGYFLYQDILVYATTCGQVAIVRTRNELFVTAAVWQKNGMTV